MEQSKKECILEAAVKAFTRLGFKKAAVDDIARDAGVAKGTVYLAAESKEDLFYQAVHRQMRAWIADVTKLIDPRMPAEQLLVVIGRAGLEYLESHPLVRDLFLGVHHGQLPRWSDKFEELRELGKGVSAEILRIGIRQGAFREDVDVEETASILQDLQLSTYVVQSRLGPGNLHKLEPRMKAGLDLVLNGLRPRVEARARAKPEHRA